MGITINNILLTELDFKRAPTFPENVNYTFQIEVGENYKSGQDTAQVFLKVTIEDENKSMALKCCMLGIFHIQDEATLPLTVEDFLRINAPALLYPYVREVVSSTTQRSGMKPVYIPVCNFKEMYDKKKEEEKTKDVIKE
jgi:preprotein translocase subunit SecB